MKKYISNNKFLSGKVLTLCIFLSSNYSYAREVLVEKYRSEKSEYFNTKYADFQYEKIDGEWKSYPEYATIEEALSKAKREAKDHALGKCESDIIVGQEECRFIKDESSDWTDSSYRPTEGKVTFRAVYGRFREEKDDIEEDKNETSVIDVNGDCKFAVSPTKTIQGEYRLDKKIFEGTDFYYDYKAVARAKAACTEAGYSNPTALEGYPLWTGSTQIHKVEGSKTTKGEDKITILTPEEVKSLTCANLDKCIEHYASNDLKNKMAIYLEIYKAKDCNK